MTSNQGMPAGSPNGGEQWTQPDYSPTGSYSEFPSSWSRQLYLCICFLITTNRIKYFRSAYVLSSVALPSSDSI